MSSHVSHLFGVPYLSCIGTHTAEFHKILCSPMGTSASANLAAKPPIHMHIGVATSIAQREGNVSPLMQENIKKRRWLKNTMLTRR